MAPDVSIWSYIFDAGIVVKCVMLILLFASITSWAIIIERLKFYKKQWQNLKEFESQFWSGITMPALHQQIMQQENNPTGLAKIFSSAYQTFSKCQSTPHYDTHAVMDNTQRAMQIAENDIQDQLEQPLGLLMTIGSMSPFVGIFGTVWGVMTAFQALGAVHQASIAMVAPGISEALITTAIGLFTAIPAAVFYNRFVQEASRFQNRAAMFSNELTNILQRAAVSP